VFGALIALTVLTVGVSFLDLGAWHTVVGLTIACCKALLVAFFFMHLLSSTRLTWVVAVAGLFWLGILIGLTLSDYLTRYWLAY
jgi:cytochrome c oxidase subunit 4